MAEAKAIHHKTTESLLQSLKVGSVSACCSEDLARFVLHPSVMKRSISFSNTLYAQVCDNMQSVGRGVLQDLEQQSEQLKLCEHDLIEASLPQHSAVLLSLNCRAIAIILQCSELTCGLGRAVQLHLMGVRSPAD